MQREGTFGFIETATETLIRLVWDVSVLVKHPDGDGLATRKRFDFSNESFENRTGLRRIAGNLQAASNQFFFSGLLHFRADIDNGGANFFPVN